MKNRTIEKDVLTRDDLKVEKEKDIRNHNKVQRDTLDKNKNNDKEKSENKKMKPSLNRENVLNGVSKNIDRIEKQGFEKPLIEDLKKYSNEVLLDARCAEDLKDLADKYFSKEGKENLEIILNARYNPETERPGYEVIKELTVLNKIEKMEKDGIKVVKDYKITPEKLQEDVSKFVDKLESMKTRESLEHRIQIDKDVSIGKSVLCDHRYNPVDRERFTSEREIEKQNKSFFEREIANKYKEDIDYVSKWGYEREPNKDKDIEREIGKDRERAIFLEKTIQELAISPVVENYILSLDKTELENVLLKVNSFEEYREFLDKVSNSVKEEDREAVKAELNKNEIQQMALWSYKERTGGLSRDLDFTRLKSVPKDIYTIRDDQNTSIKNFIAYEKYELSKIADKDAEGRYVFTYEKDNFIGKINTLDRVKAMAAIHLSMIDRDDKGSKDFIRDNIDSRVDYKNPEDVRKLITELTTDVRQSTDNERASRVLITNGKAISFEKDEKIELGKYRGRFYDRKEATGVFKVHDKDFLNKVHRGDLEGLAKIKTARDFTNSLEKALDKQDKKDGLKIDKDKTIREIEKEKTTRMIEMLSRDENIINKFSSRIIEGELVKNVGVREFGPVIEKQALIAYNSIKFGEDKDLKDKMEKAIMESKSGLTRDERALYECFKAKLEVSQAFIRGELESIEEDIRIDTKYNYLDVEGMSYKGRNSDELLEKDIREMIVYRATCLPNLKNERLEILLKEKDRAATIKELERSLLKSLDKEDVFKMQIALQTNRMQEIIQRTAFALRGDNKNENNYKINSFLIDKYAYNDSSRDNKLIEDNRKEMLKNLANFRLFTLDKTGLNVNGINDKFNFFNGSGSRDVMVSTMINRDLDMMDKERLEEKMESMTRSSTSHLMAETRDINQIFVHNWMLKYDNIGVKIDAKVLGTLLHENKDVPDIQNHFDDMDQQDKYVIEKGMYDSLRDFGNIYKQNEDGTFRTLTMGDVSKEEVENFTTVLNKVLDAASSTRFANANSIKPEHVVEILVRGQQVQEITERQVDRHSPNIFNREYYEFEFTYAGLEKELERHFDEVVKDTIEVEFFPKSDGRFHDASYKDMITINPDTGRIVNQELRDYYVQRAHQLKDALGKVDVMREKEREIALNDYHKGIQDRRNPFDKESDILKLELNRAENEMIKLKQDKASLKAYADGLRKINENKMNELKRLYDERERELPSSPFRAMEVLSLKIEKFKDTLAIKKEMREFEKIIEMREAGILLRKDADKATDRVSELRSKLKDLEHKSNEYNLKERWAFVEKGLIEKRAKWGEDYLGFHVRDKIADTKYIAVKTYEDVLRGNEYDYGVSIPYENISERDFILQENRHEAFDMRYRNLIAELRNDEMYAEYKNSKYAKIVEEEVAIQKASLVLEELRDMGSGGSDMPYRYDSSKYLPYEVRSKEEADLLNNPYFQLFYRDEYYNEKMLNNLYIAHSRLKDVENNPSLSEDSEEYKFASMIFARVMNHMHYAREPEFPQIREFLDKGKPREQLLKVMEKTIWENQHKESVANMSGQAMYVDTTEKWRLYKDYPLRWDELAFYKGMLSQEEAINATATQMEEYAMSREIDKYITERDDLLKSMYIEKIDAEGNSTLVTNEEAIDFYRSYYDELDQKVEDLKAAYERLSLSNRLREEKEEREKQMNRIDWVRQAKLDKESSHSNTN